MTPDLLLLILSSLAEVCICFFVIFRNYRNPANFLFGITGIGITAWSVSNFLASTLPSYDTLAATRMTGLLAALVLPSLLALSYVFPRRLVVGRVMRYFAPPIVLLMVGLSLTPLFIKSGVLTSSGLKLTQGTLYPIYPLYILANFVLCNVNFVRQFKHARKTAKSQLKFMWLGIAVTVALVVLSNVLLPLITKNWTTSKYGTIFTFPFVAITAYAILKQRMFDLRLIISRTIAYFLTIGIVATIYSLLIVFISTRLANFGSLSLIQVLALVLPTLFIGITFQGIQKFTERLTTLIFYRNAYDSQVVLDRLSDMLLVENDIDKMMAQSMDLLRDALQPAGDYLAVLNDSEIIYKHHQVPEAAFKNPESLLPELPKAATVTDASDLERSHLKELMDGQRCEVMLRLGNRHKPAGMLLLGPKRNGTLYSEQDLALLRISAKNLGVALENAKKYEQIMRFADTLNQEVTSATSRLRKANKKLKSLDALKDDFLSAASHQLSSPAVSVHDALAMLNQPNLTAKDRQEMLELAESSSERLVTVVRTMLNWARLESGRFTIDVSEADIVEIFNKVLSRVKINAEQRGITLNQQLPDKTIMAQVDTAKIGEAMANYIENAIKYSDNATTINISLEKHPDGRIVFEVADEGIGVPPDERPKLFGRFYRASNARKEQPDGNGIGLYVVKMIARGHGGDAYYSPRETKGSVFGFWIRSRSI